jgi:YgiT-type zinc finger domain-containing protein
MFNYNCEYCKGVVREKIIKQEAFKHKRGFVILENVTIGICDHCGNRYYSANTLKKVNEIATGKKKARKTKVIPVASAA